MKAFVEKVKANYHWIIVAVSFTFVFVTLGMMNNIHNIYVIPVTEELGISRSAFSLTRSICGITYLVSNGLFVVIYRKFGFRIPAVLFTLITGAVYVWMSKANNLIPFYFGNVVLGVAEVFMNTAGISKILTNWFDSHQGKIMGVVMAASGLGGSVLSLLLTGIMEKWSWRTSLVVIGIIHVVVAVLVFILIKDYPEKLKLKPFSSPEKKSGKPVRSVKTWKGASMNVLVKQPFFYLVVIYTVLSCIAAYCVSASINAHFSDCGLNASQSAVCYSILMFGLAVSKIILGAVRDRFGACTSIVITTAAGMIGLIFMAITNSYLMAIASAVLMSVGYCMMGFNQPLIALEMFGKEGYNGGLSIIVMCLALGNIIASPIVNLIFEAIGTYKPVYVVLAFVMAACIALYIIAKKQCDKFRKLNDAEE